MDSPRVAAVVTGLINAVVNPLLEVAVNRGGFQPLPAAAANLATTSIVMCVLVAFFSRRGMSRGVRFGLAGAAVIAAAAVALAGLGVAGMPFGALLAVKAAYCGPLAYLVAR